MVKYACPSSASFLQLEHSWDGPQVFRHPECGIFELGCVAHMPECSLSMLLNEMETAVGNAVPGLSPEQATKMKVPSHWTCFCGGKEMKKVFALLLSVAVLFSLSACGEGHPSEQNPDGSTTQTTRSSHDAQYTPTQSEAAIAGRQMYEEIIDAFLIIDDELSRGWFDEDGKSLVRLIKGNNVSADASTMELLRIYRSFDTNIQYTDYCIRDFFTVNDYNESTNTGVYRFFEAINQLEDEKLDGQDIVRVDTDGDVDGFNIDDVSAVADALGVSEELVKIMLYAATDVGFDIDFTNF